MTQYSVEQSAGFAKAARFSTSGNPSPAAIIVAIAAADHGLQVGADWYNVAYGQTLAGHSFIMYPAYTSGRYKQFTSWTQQVVSTGSGAGDAGITLGDVTGAAGDTIGGAVDTATEIASAVNTLSGSLAPLKSLASLGDIAKLFVKAGAWVADRHNWMRILQIVLGAAGIYVGITIIRTDLDKLESGAAVAALAA